MAEGRKKSSSIKSSKNSSDAHPKGCGRRRKGGRKALVYIPAGRLVALCAAVIVACSLLLVVSTAVELRGGGVSDGGLSAPSFSQKGRSEMDAPASMASRADVSIEESIIEENRALPKVREIEIPDSAPNSVPEQIPAPLPQRTEPPSVPRPVQASVSVAALVPSAAPPPSPSPSPKRTAESLYGGKGAVPSDSQGIPEIPPARSGATLVFIFDDGGHNLEHLERFMSLPFPFTVAVLPQLSHSKEAAARVRESGNEVMLHQPMQAVNQNENPGPGAITAEHSADEIRGVLYRNVAEIGPVSGINNHEGSMISGDEFRIGTVLQAASEMGLYFLDSRTTSLTRVPNAAQSLGLTYYERNVFLDNTKERSDIVAEIMRGLSVANRKGCAVMIGHIWSADVLPEILSEVHPLLVRAGYLFSTVSNSGALISPRKE